MTGADAPMGHTGQKVEEAGTYRCAGGDTWSYVPGDRFRECPSTGRPTTWRKTRDPKEPDFPQR